MKWESALVALLAVWHSGNVIHTKNSFKLVKF